MTTVISGDASADFQTPLPVSEGGTGASTSVGSGGVMLSTQTGSAPVFGARAWCVFDGTSVGTNAPTAGGNVTNITRNGVGDYTINFTEALQDTNYSICGSSTGGAASGLSILIHAASAASVPTLKTTTQVQIRVTNDAGMSDGKQVALVIFR